MFCVRKHLNIEDTPEYLLVFCARKGGLNEAELPRESSHLVGIGVEESEKDMKKTCSQPLVDQC